MLFDRVATLEIETEAEVVALGQVRLRFDVRKSRSDTPNELFVEAWNVSPNTRAAAETTDARARLKAGYTMAEVAVVADCEITRTLFERRNPNTTLSITAQEGANRLREERVTLSFEAGATVQQVLDAIAGQLEFPLRPLDDVDLSQRLRGGYAHAGPAGVALDDVVRRVGGRWSIQNSELLVLNEQGRVEGEAVRLTPQSGLIGSPEPVEDRLSSERVVEDPRQGFRVTSLLLPQVEPGDIVEIESADVSGQFVVDQIQHRGDTRGPEWYSVLTVFE